MRVVKPDEFYIGDGAHALYDGEPEGRCVMEWFAYLYQQKHSDSPVGVHETIRMFCISLNDQLPDDQRQLLAPYLGRMMGSDALDNYGLAWKALNFIAKTWTPLWLDAVGYKEEAQRLRELPRLDALCSEADVQRVECVLDEILLSIPEEQREKGRWDGTRVAEGVVDATRAIEGSCDVRSRAQGVIGSCAKMAACGLPSERVDEIESEVQIAVIGLLDEFLPEKPSEPPKRRGWKKLIAGGVK